MRTVGRVLFRGSAELAVLTVITALLMGVTWYFDRTLFTAQSLLGLAVDLFPLAMAAIGQGLVMLIRGIDLSVGSVMSVAMAVFALNAGQTGGTAVLAMLLAIGIAVLAGLLNGVLVAYARLQPIIVTLSTSFLWSGVAVWLLPKPAGSVPEGLNMAYVNGWYGIAVPTVLIVVALVVWKAISRTAFGLSVYAIGGNTVGAYANGIKVSLVTVATYVLSAVFIAMGGIALAVQTGTGDATIGVPYTLNSITACILGGIIFLGGVGYMRGAVIGALVVILLSRILLFSGVSPFYQLVVQGAVLIVAVSIKTVLHTERSVS